MKKPLFLFFCLLFFLNPHKTYSLQDSVIISEIAWMGTEKSYSDEWLELYNNSNNEINLNGWEIKSETGKLNINLEGKIAGKGFFILERTDDQSLPDIKADLLYKGSLNNTGEHLKLLNPNSNLIDEVNCQDGWFAGDNTVKKTMERKNFIVEGNDKNNWQTSEKPGGSPGKSNKAPEEKTGQIKEEKSAGSEILKTADYNFKVYINELLPSPEGADNQNEWIEIFNENQENLNLSGWQIKDAAGKTSSYFFPKETTVGPNDFLVLYSSLTKITLNNDGDSVLLISPQGETIDNVSFKKAPPGKSYSKINNDWAWSDKPSPGKPNVFLNQEENKDEIMKKNDLKEEKIKNYLKEKSLASVSKSLSGFNFYFILLIALFLSFFLGISFVLLKKRLN